MNKSETLALGVVLPRIFLLLYKVLYNIERKLGNSKIKSLSLKILFPVPEWGFHV